MFCFLLCNIFGPKKVSFVDAWKKILVLCITYWENFERASFHVVLQGFLFARHPWDHSVGRCVRFFPSFFRSIAVNQFNIHDQFYIHFDFNDHQIWIHLFIVVFSRMDTKLTVLIVAWKRHVTKFLSSRRTVNTNQMFKTSLEVIRGMLLYFILPSIFQIWCAKWCN